MAAKFVFSFYYFRPTGDLSGKIQISLQLDSLQCHKADPCILCEIKNSLANIANLIYLSQPLNIIVITTFNLFIQMPLNINCVSEVSTFGTSFLTIWQLNHILNHFALLPSCGSHPYRGICIQAQIPGTWFKSLLIFYDTVACV